jgi:shikimate kinase
VLVGMMGSGKSAVARRLAGAGVTLLDTDHIIERDTGRTVREVFETEGEPAFRALEETAVAQCLAHSGDAVLAAAGGAVTSRHTREALNAARREGRAYVVWLRTGTSELVRRVGRSGHRPLLDGDAQANLERLNAARAGLYEEVADIAIDTDGRSVADVSQRIAEAFTAAGGTWGAHV